MGGRLGGRAFPVTLQQAIAYAVIEEVVTAADF
jgi:hypothetical protein